MLQELSKRPFLILYVTILKTKYDDINLGFRLFEDLKLHTLKHVSAFDELKPHCYLEEAHRSFRYCYILPLVLCVESFESLNIFFSAKHLHQ